MSRRSKIGENDIAALAATVRAPASLHRRVQEMAAEAQSRPARRRVGWMPGRAGWRPGRLGGIPRRAGWAPAARRLRVAPARGPRAAATGVALAAALAVVLVLALPGGGGSSTPTPRAAAALALAPATLPAPGESPSNRSQLTASVGGVAFPYWEERFGWRDSGARSDRLGGRAVTTVFYSNPRGQRIGYAIVSGPAPPIAGAGAVVKRWGVAYRLSAEHGANVIVWHRGGRLCVMAGRGISPHTLLDLASWGSRRTDAA